MSETKKTILLVDDEPDVLSFVEAIISEMGDFNIVKASDGESALKNAKARRPDLIILDVMMPNKSGFQVFDELKQDEMTASVPVIMLTGVSGETGLKFSGQDMGEYFGKEPFAFIEKPVDPARVQKAVASALGG
jgi:CheY-like chemotaxis protein